jgi:hypothetical protein
MNDVQFQWFDTTFTQDVRKDQPFITLRGKNDPSGHLTKGGTGRYAGF